jgi:hypothetical protein
VGGDTVAEVGAEVVLDRLWDGFAIGIGCSGVGEYGLKVALDQGVERRGGGGRVGGRRPRGRAAGCRRLREGAAGGGPARCESARPWAYRRRCGGRRGDGMAGWVIAVLVNSVNWAAAGKARN